MGFGDLAEQQDLRPLFGSLSDGDNERLLGRLLAIDSELAKLAVVASEHVGVLYRHVKLFFVVRSESAGIAGGPSGDAGDLWFDVDFSTDDVSGKALAPPWRVESAIYVFCADSPEPRGDSNNHALVRLVASPESPVAVVDMLEAHVKAIQQELLTRSARVITGSLHSQLP